MNPNNNLTYLIILSLPGSAFSDSIYLYARNPSDPVYWWWGNYDPSMPVPLPFIPADGLTSISGSDTYLYADGAKVGVLRNFTYKVTQANTFGTFVSLGSETLLYFWNVFSVQPTTFNDVVRPTGCRLQLPRKSL